MTGIGSFEISLPQKALTDSEIPGSLFASISESNDSIR